MIKTIKIQSTTRNICEVELFLSQIFKELQFSRKIYCKIYLSTIEAVNNAILHGNNNVPTKNVDISFNNLKTKFSVIIKDEGNGFDYYNVSDPTKPLNLKKESGRGIFIMKQYADKVTFNESGNCVNLLFNK
ncbi:MAG TPA: ATP-binding protein [Prolixibacteraceae bacterium]|nr:ATP-binding protein [Prolixibacteraceae bacterium]